MLSERQKMILRMIVEDYIQSAEPVGSRSISKHVDMGLSAATIRNEMADLEEQGYLEQPHTSAGRVPSQQGYRYYVDHLLQLGERLKQEEISKMKMLFSERVDEIEKVAQQTALYLSTFTQYTAVVLGPQVYDNTLRSLQVVPITEHSAVLLVVTSTGQVQNKTVSFPDDISLSQVEQLVRLLNEKLVGIPIYQMRSRIFEEISREVARQMRDFEEAQRILDRLLNVIVSEKDGKVFLGGTTNMLLQPEFHNVEKAKSVLSWLEHHDLVSKALLQESKWSAPLSVRIGGENELSMLQNCSLVTATYRIGEDPVGVIGIIGPTRMEYGRVIRVLDYLSKEMTQLATKWYSG